VFGFSVENYAIQNSLRRFAVESLRTLEKHNIPAALELAVKRIVYGLGFCRQRRLRQNKVYMATVDKGSKTLN
jgi:hypothetical protein